MAQENPQQGLEQAAEQAVKQVASRETRSLETLF